MAPHQLTKITVPYERAGEVDKLLREVSTGFDGGTDGKVSTYRIFNLDVADLILMTIDLLSWRDAMMGLGEGKGRTD